MAMREEGDRKFKIRPERQKFYLRHCLNYGLHPTIDAIKIVELTTFL